MKKIEIKGEIEGVPLSLETGYLAPQTQAAVKTRFGETVVLTVLTVGEAREAPTFLPLTIEYLEKMYAGGLISGSRFIKREMRPSDDETLRARLIDHATRSLFKDDFYNEVQVVSLVLSYDGKNDPGTAAAIGSSAAMSIGGLPIQGPIGAVKIGLVDEKPIFNLQDDQEEESNLAMHVFATEDGITSVELEGRQIPEDEYNSLLEKGFEKCQPLVEMQKEFARKAGKELNYVPNTNISDLANEIYPKIKDEVEKEVFGSEKVDMYDKLDAIERKLMEEYKEEDPQVVDAAVFKVMKKITRASIENGKRPDGRGIDDLREISVEAGVLPRTHGSAIFNRGLTQCMSIVTLGSTKLEQLMEGMGGEESKRFMHHYNMKGYANGEVDPRLYYPGRREIGHGAIGEKALRPMIPSESEFPYTIRVVSEVLSSNGSTSMAATCASSVALMDAGVPIEEAVGGISMGLVYNDDKDYKLLTDIQGLEDGAGDMDYKIAGTRNGINAIQLDNKLGAVPVEVLKEAAKKSAEVRGVVLDKMATAISEPRKELSKYAPKISTIKIDPSKIGDVIGPGGKVIRGITEETGAEIDIEEDGSVHIAAVDEDSRVKAEEMIHDLVDEAEIGKEYIGEVDRIENYGAFIKISGAITGLLHVSEIADKYISDVSKVFSIGDKVKVKVKDIDDQGKVSVTMKDVEGNDEILKKVSAASKQGPPQGGRPQRNDRGGDTRRKPRREKRW